MADDASPKPPSKSETTRQAILHAAAGLFRAHGYAAVSLRDIAEAVGMKTGSLYYHFDSKESLVEEILTLGTQGAFDASKAAVEALGAGADPVDKLGAVVCAHTRFLHDEADFASANLKILHQVPPAIRERHVRQDQAYGHFVARIIDEIAAMHGLAPGIDPSILRMLCFGAMNWSISWYDPQGASPSDIAGQLMTMVRCGALATRDPP
ncbi:MAG TPA: TetR/AcrR family transcriptional regulator [Caulobacteraceae bacterium]|jgi:AcrR family transcriptional regulator|nr:TetR/AcrR family transcriptional regulator [Caulobacteraceae bacterium]